MGFYRFKYMKCCNTQLSALRPLPKAGQSTHVVWWEDQRIPLSDFCILGLKEETVSLLVDGTEKKLLTHRSRTKKLTCPAHRDTRSASRLRTSSQEQAT
jgi:hypothetical protein